MSASDAPLPRRDRRIFRFMRGYARYKIRNAFDAFRISKSSQPPPETDEPLIVVMNHPSWWDPMTAMVLSRSFGDRAHYAPIEAKMLEKYPVFGKIGIFGIEPGTRQGAATFLRTAEAILNAPNTMLWVTAQGHFVDVRQRPVNIQAGVGYAAARMSRGLILPLAVEYLYWQESKPELLARWGEPLEIADGTERDGRAWTVCIEESLTKNMDVLAQEAMARDASLFDNVLEGTVGVGGVYGLWQRVRAWLAGRQYDPRHESSESVHA